MPPANDDFSDSIKNATKNLLSTEGPDVANIIDNRKFEIMKAWLDTENVLLLRSPPGSGKTTFALSFAAHLVSQKFKVTYLNASLSRSAVDARSMDEVWREAFESDSTFSDMCKKPFEEDSYIIIDEAQSWYPLNAKDWRVQLDGFWADVKFFVKPAFKLADYVKTVASKPDLPSIPIGRVRLLCLAAYGEANVGSIATPLVFVDPMDIGKNMRLPLGLEFLRLDREMTHALITKFVEIKGVEGKMSFDADVCELIYEEIEDHVGAVRTLLFHFVSSDKRNKQDVIDFTRQDIPKSDLSAYRAFLSVSEATIRRLLPEDLEILVQCITLYKKGHRGFSKKETGISELVKLGIFVKTKAAATGGQTTVAFPSPLHFDLALYNVLHRTVELRQTHECFEHVLQELVLRMSPKVLQETTPHGDLPYECQWQLECHRSFNSMSRTHVNTSVGGEFGSPAFLDMYINAGLQWGIDLIREGDGRQLDEHFERFQPDGRYNEITLQEYALINFTSKVPDEAALDRYDSISCTMTCTQKSLCFERESLQRTGILLAIRDALSIKVYQILYFPVAPKFLKNLKYVFNVLINTIQFCMNM